jgi:peptidoglycan/LPS O-acetylase OafA/YrhL
MYNVNTYGIGRFNGVAANFGPSSGKPAGRIRGFDGLRAIAFLLVFVSHKVYFAHATCVGDIGVWLFFVLSGFLITTILAGSRSAIEEDCGSIYGSLWRFYLRRVARIFPPYYLLLALVAVISVVIPIDYFGISEKIAYVLFGTNFLVAWRDHWIGDFGHFWSLAVEEQFYLAFAPLILFVPRRYTLNVCVAVVIIGLITKAALHTQGAPAISVDVNSLVDFALIGFGGVVALNATRPAPKWFIGGGAQLAVFGLYLALAATFGTSSYIWPLAGKLVAILVGLLLFQIFQSQNTLFVAFLETIPLRHIGRISYGAYLIHPFVHFDLLQPLLHHIAAGQAPRYGQVLAELGVSLVVASLSWRYLERPIIGWAARVTSFDNGQQTLRITVSRIAEREPGRA